MEPSSEYHIIGNDIIASAFEVRNFVGRGLREHYYESALIWELRQRGHSVERGKIVPAFYKGIIIDNAFEADIVVDNKVIIEV